MPIQTKVIIGISKVDEDHRLAFNIPRPFTGLQSLMKMPDVPGNIHIHKRKHVESIANAILITGLLAECQGLPGGNSGLFGMAKVGMRVGKRPVLAAHAGKVTGGLKERQGFLRSCYGNFGLSNAPLIQTMGNHGKFSTHSTAFMDGHAAYMYMNTRRFCGPGWYALNPEWIPPRPGQHSPAKQAYWYTNYLRRNCDWPDSLSPLPE